MSQDWYLLSSSPHVFNSGFEQDEFDEYAVDGFNELLNDSPLPYSVELCNSDFTMAISIKAIVQNTTFDSDPKSLERQILVPIGTIQTGKYIRYKNRIWLIISTVDDNKIYEKAVIKICTLNLRWQNSSGTIISRWCISENATKYSSGIVDGKIITSPELQYNIKLPLDDETKNLRRDKRFLDSVEDIDGNPTAYKLTQRDTISNNYDKNNRILNLSLTEDVFNHETDNVELLIADYFSTPLPVTGQAEITYTGKLILYIGGNYKYFSGVFKDADGNILSGIVPVWSWISLSSQTEYFDAESLTDGRFRIKADMNTGLIGSKVKIMLDDMDNLYHAELLVEVGDY